MKKIFVLVTVCAFLIASTPIPARAARTLSFSGYDWMVKNGYYAPGPNKWSDAADQVFVDANGALHLSVAKRGDGKWYASEVWLPASLGYGVYEFEFASRVDTVDTNLVVAPFLYQDDTHELDIEYTNWKVAGGANVWYAAQPEISGVSNANFKFTQAVGSVTARIIWQSTGITFETAQNGVVLARWFYNGKNNFVPGGERAHINFWMTSGTSPSDGRNKEIIVNRFTFFAVPPVVSSVVSKDVVPIIETSLPKKHPRIIKPKLLPKKFGGPDGARTRDLPRDRRTL